MRLTFQKKIASSQMTLPIVCAISIAMWLLIPNSNAESLSVFSSYDYGLWQFVPQFLQVGYWGTGLAMALVAGCVYLLAELNNSNVLLRISSRMLSSMLALLCGLAVMLHNLQPGNVLMLFSVLSFFTLFLTYQLPSPMLTFTTFLMISASSLIFPKMLLIIPVYWILLGCLRAFSFRCLIASLLGTILPYWFYICIAFAAGNTQVFFSHIQSLITFQWYDYSQLTIMQILPFSFFTLLFAIGTLDFFQHSFLDKTRPRMLFNIVAIHGLFIIIYMCLQPQYLDVLLPVLLIDTAILFGHFFALTYTRLSHIVNLVLLAMAIGFIAFVSLYHA